MAEGGDLGTSVDVVPAAGGKKKKGGKKAGLVDQLMQNPEVMDALKEQLAGKVDLSLTANHGAFAESLPAACKKRVKALKNLQVEYQKVDARFHEQLHKLECQYAEQFQPLFAKRQQIISGEYEPTDKECEFTVYDVDGNGDEKTDDDKTKDEKTDDEKSDDKKPEDGADKEEPAKEDAANDLASDLEKKANLDDAPASSYDENTKGIPEFWFTCLKNVEEISTMIEEVDEPILTHLENVTVKLLESPMGFVLEFHFSDNPHFTNKVLTKTYYLKSEVDGSDPFSFDGPEIYKAEGCTIDWKKGKNVTVKLVKKKQRNRNKTQTRVITKEMPSQSFFHFFTPPTLPDGDEDDVDEDVAEHLARDYDIGLFIRENLIPKAVLYFTGEAIDDDDDSDDDEEFEDDNDELDDDEDGDPDYKPPASGEQPQECKQQ